MLFGVIGTIITFSVVAPLTYIANKKNFFWFSTKTNSSITNSTLVDDYLEFDNITDIIVSQTDIPVLEAVKDDRLINFSIKEILLFSSVISATDTVAALTFVKEDSEPKLFAILFGEGVINDAVCIVLYNIIKNFFASSKEGISDLYRIHLKDSI
jgi:hypothetical protein